MFDSNVSKAIVAGIISSLIVIVVFQPLLGYMGAGAGMLWSVLANFIYAEAARGPSNNIADSIPYILAFVYWSCGILFVLVGAFGLAPGVESEEQARRSQRRLVRRGLQFLAGALILSPFAATYVWGATLSRSFEQRVTVMAPFLSDSEEEQVRAMWASMATQGDFIATRDSMRKLSVKYNMKLPRSRRW